MPLEENITKEENELVNDPVLGDVISGGKEVIDGNIVEEDRGYDSCTDPQYRFADVTSSDRLRNDPVAAWRGGTAVSFKLFKRDGSQSNYTVSAIPFVNQPNAFYCSFDWRDALIADGVISECYTLESTSIISGVTQIKINKGTFNVQPYEINGKINPILLRDAPVRLLSEFNDVNDFVGFNFTGSRILDCVRLSGKFGYFDDNTEVDNVEQMTGRMEKVKNEDFISYELRLNLSSYCHVEPLRFHLLSANRMWATDQNPDNYDYFIKDRFVILQEGLTPEHFDGSREIKGVVKFQLKIRNRRSHFQNNRKTAENEAPPILCPPVTSNLITYPTKTGQTISFGDGTDGDIQFGRGVDWFTLDNNNPYGNTTRFLDDLGGTSFTNGILIDWAMVDEVNETVLGWSVANNGSDVTWEDARLGANSSTLGGYTDWRLPNQKVAETIWYTDSVSGRGLNYLPFNDGSNRLFWTGTTDPNLSTYALVLPNRRFDGATKLKTTAIAIRYITVRVFTYSELGL